MDEAFVCPRFCFFFFGLVCLMVGWWVGGLVAWLVGWSVGRSVGRLVGWSVGRLVGWSVGRLDVQPLSGKACNRGYDLLTKLLNIQVGLVNQPLYREFKQMLRERAMTNSHY